jgi:hypothetical protein
VIVELQATVAPRSAAARAVRTVSKENLRERIDNNRVTCAGAVNAPALLLLNDRIRRKV